MTTELIYTLTLIIFILFFIHLDNQHCRDKERNRSPTSDNKAFKQEIIDRMNYFYRQTDNSMKFPNSAEGDLLKMIYKFLMNDK